MMKDSFANGGVFQKNVAVTPFRLNDASIGRQKGINTHNIFATLLYAFGDFITIFFSLLLSDI